ncbi:MAG: SRPBCC family protein, partial [Chloroflexi bacterium]|nr:SRPBCC family protein [Chloroflexota bacterium]
MGETCAPTCRSGGGGVGCGKQRQGGAMLRNLILGLVMVVAVFFAIGFVLPDKVHVERSVKVQAPASQVFALVDGFRQFEKWSPWADKDPQMKTQLSGPPLGVGAHYDWSGNQAVGAGSQEIVRSTPESQVKTRLKFTGFEGESLASFDLEPDGELTRVTWSVDIPLGGNPIAHYFGLMMKGEVGADYERGLNKLRGLAESGSKTDFAGLHGELVELKPQTYAYVSGSSSTDSAAITKALAAAYAKVNAYMAGSEGLGNGRAVGAAAAGDVGVGLRLELHQL